MQRLRISLRLVMIGAVPSVGLLQLIRDTFLNKIIKKINDTFYVHVHVSMYLCMYVCMYLCIYVSTCMCIYVHVHVSMYLCIYVHVHVQVSGL